MFYSATFDLLWNCVWLKGFVHFPPTCYFATGLDLSLTNVFIAPRTPTDVLCGKMAKIEERKNPIICFELYQQPTPSDITNLPPFEMILSF